MVSLAAETQEAVVADAAALPFEDGTFDLVTAFMSLQDLDDLDGALREAGRVLEPGGRLCFCVTHPLESAGAFTERRADAPFVVDSYLERRRIGEVRGRDGISIHFAAEHRPLEAYSRRSKEAASRWRRCGRSSSLPRSGVTRPPPAGRGSRRSCTCGR